MDYTHDAPIVTAGRPAVFPEREYWQRLHTVGRRVAVILITVLTLMFAYEALLVLPYSDSIADIVATCLVVIPAAVGVALYPVRVRKSARRALQTVWYNEQADKACLTSGCTFTFYGDRVVRTDLRGETVLYFDRITLFTETIHGFYLQAGTTDMLLRAADLTAEQAVAIRIHLRSHIPPQRIRVKGQVQARLAAPLSLPVFESRDRVLARASVKLVRSTHQPLREWMQQFVLPAMIVYGTVIAQVWPLVYFYPVNLLLVCGVCVIVGVLLTTWFAGNDKKVPVLLAFTQEGLAAFAGGQSYFLVWERLRLHATPHGIWVISPDGGRMFVPFQTMDNPDPVRQLIKGESYNG